jgi:uncharacterized protein
MLSIDTEDAIEAPLAGTPSEPHSAAACVAEVQTLQSPLDDSIAVGLSSPAAYPERPPAIEVIETHRAWVFLTPTHAYKLAKARVGERRDPCGLERRKQACQRELELNRRLAKSVYLGVLPVTRSRHHWVVGGDGPPADWVLQMRRLPREVMLDAAIATRSVNAGQIDDLAIVLRRFYASTDATPVSASAYRGRLLDDIRSKSASLCRGHYGLAPDGPLRLASALTQWVTGEASLLGSRASAVVDAHGDLRPEHICLEPEPVVIDCLEFDAQLRRLDPLSELAFVALECRRLGAPWVGELLLSRFVDPGDDRFAALLRFYQAYHALVRAAVAIWHLDDPQQFRRDHWRQRAERYVALGASQLGVASST